MDDKTSTVLTGIVIFSLFSLTLVGFIVLASSFSGSGPETKPTTKRESIVYRKSDATPKTTTQKKTEPAAAVSTTPAQHERNCRPRETNPGLFPADKIREDLANAQYYNLCDPGRSRKLRHALVAGVTFKDNLSPNHFCYGECVLRGRLDLVEELEVMLETDGRQPRDVGLTASKLKSLRRRGAQEYFTAWKKESKREPKGYARDLQERLCELAAASKASGLYPAQIRQLNCATGRRKNSYY